MKTNPRRGVFRDLDFKTGDGLIPVVAQDFASKDVLMLAYMNEEALKETLKTGYAHYWSRSRRSLWRKGETSGNVQKVKAIHYDCDGDALLLLVDQKGYACHTGNKTCFFKEIPLRSLRRRD